MAQTIKITLKRCLHRVLPDIADSSETSKMEYFSLLTLVKNSDQLAFMKTRGQDKELLAAKKEQVSG